MRLRTAIALLALLAGVGLFDARRMAAERQAAERAASMETLRLRAWARANSAAGVSIRSKHVPPTSAPELEAVNDLPGFRTYSMRCASCHVLPDPAAHPAKVWRGKVDLMRWHIGQAGVVPPADSEMAAVKEFLGEAARRLRND